MTEPAPLQPPAAEASLSLSPPAPLGAVATTQAPKIAPPVDAAALPGLDAKVEATSRRCMTLTSTRRSSPPRPTTCGSMGDDDIRKAAETRTGCCTTPVRAMQQGGARGGLQGRPARCSTCAAPSRTSTRRAHRGIKKLLGMIPFGDRIDRLLPQVQSAQSHLDAIIKALYDGQDELRQDNAALDQEKVHLWETMRRLNQYIYIAERLDARLVRARSPQIEATDPEQAKALREDVLFYVRQKHQDLLTQLAVSIQGYLAIDIVIKNNLELIKGVDRATTTTVSALRTAVIVAQALANQKLVLDQITALNTTTSKLIESTSEMLAGQSVEIQQAGRVGDDRDAPAAEGVREHLPTMDAIDTFKGRRSTSMAQTIAVLRERDRQVASPTCDRVSRARTSGSRRRVPSTSARRRLSSPPAR